MEEAQRRYGRGYVNKKKAQCGRIAQALRIWKGEPEKEPQEESVTIESWEHYQEVTRKPKRRLTRERYRNLKDRNSKLAKLKYPWIK